MLPLEPHHVDALSVWSDQLQQEANPLGEFLALSLNATGETDSGRFVQNRNRREALLAEHETQWLGSRLGHKVERWVNGLPFRVSSNRLEDFEQLAQSTLGAFTRELEFQFPHQPSDQTLAISQAFQWVAGVRFLTANQLPPTSNLIHHPLWNQIERTSMPMHPFFAWPYSTPRLTDLRIWGFRSLAQPIQTALPPRLTTLEFRATELQPETLIPELIPLSHLSKLTLATEATGWLEGLTTLIRHLPLKRVRLEVPFLEHEFEVLLREFARLSRLTSIELYGASIGKRLRAMANKQLPQLLVMRRAPPHEPWDNVKSL